MFSRLRRIGFTKKLFNSPDFRGTRVQVARHQKAAGVSHGTWNQSFFGHSTPKKTPPKDVEDGFSESPTPPAPKTLC